MRERFTKIQLSPHLVSGLTLLLVASMLVASFGLVSASNDRSRSKRAAAETNLRVVPASRSLSMPAASPAPTPVPTPVPSPSPYEVSPSSSKQGQQPEVIAISKRCEEDLAKDPPSTSPRNPLKDLQLHAPDGSGISVTNLNATDCWVNAKLSIASDAPLGIVKLRLVDKKGIPQLVLDFSVTGITAGPIPPGLNNKGQVDVLWSVLPDQVVHDNYGAKVASEYFCIDAVIGNDSGYDLQIASIGFTAPMLSPDPSNPRYRVPNTGYRVVRGTLQRRELLNPRSLILNGIKVAGPLLTGFLPFFHNMVHTTNFSELINIISNPLEKGFEQAVPDTVPFQVNRLDDQTFRDDIATRTVIPNNIQTRITTFVPKELLFPDGPDKLLKKHKAVENRTVDGVNFNRRDPGQVMRLLGDIVIIGEQIEHVNRIRVVSTGLETQPTDRSISGKITDACNTGVGGVTMTLSGGADFTSKDVTTSPDGTYNFVNIPTGRTYTVTPKLENLTFNPESPGSETFTLNGTRTNLNFRADYSVLVITGKIIQDSKAIQDVSVSLTPAGLAKDVMTNAAGVFRFEVPGSKVKLPTTYTITPKSDKYKFDTDSKTWTCDQREVDFDATPIPSPTPKASP
jgi:hypothetical protein